MVISDFGASVAQRRAGPHQSFLQFGHGLVCQDFSHDLGHLLQGLEFGHRLAAPGYAAIGTQTDLLAPTVRSGIVNRASCSVFVARHKVVAVERRVNVRRSRICGEPEPSADLMQSGLG